MSMVNLFFWLVLAVLAVSQGLVSVRAPGVRLSLGLHASRNQRNSDDASLSLDETLRRLVISLTALQVLGGGPLDVAAAASGPTVAPAVEVIYPSTLRAFTEKPEANPLLIFTNPAPFTFPKDYAITLSGNKRFGLGEITSTVPAKKWFISGFGDAQAVAPKVSSASAEVTAGAFSSLPYVQDLRQAFQFGLSRLLQDWMPSASLLAIVLIANAIQYSGILKKLLDEEVAKVDELTSSLDFASQEAKDANALRSDAIAMALQMEELQGNLQAALAREKSSANWAATSDKAAASASETAASLRLEVESLRMQVSEAAVASAAKIAAGLDRIASLQSRDRKIVDAVKLFMTEQGYLSPALAGMLLSESAPDIIEEASRRGKRGGASTKREQELLHENAVLKRKIQDLTAPAPPAGSGARVDEEAYMKVLTAEIDDLKQKLLNSDERFMDLQRDMLSKVDSAKAVAKELNARLGNGKKVSPLSLMPTTSSPH